MIHQLAGVGIGQAFCDLLQIANLFAHLFKEFGWQQDDGGASVLCYDQGRVEGAQQCGCVGAEFIQTNRLRFLWPYQLKAIHQLQDTVQEDKDCFLMR